MCTSQGSEWFSGSLILLALLLALLQAPSLQRTPKPYTSCGAWGSFGSYFWMGPADFVWGLPGMLRIEAGTGPRAMMTALLRSETCSGRSSSRGTCRVQVLTVAYLEHQGFCHIYTGLQPTCNENLIVMDAGICQPKLTTQKGSL